MAKQNDGDPNGKLDQPSGRPGRASPRSLALSALLAGIEVKPGSGPGGDGTSGRQGDNGPGKDAAGGPDPSQLAILIARAMIEAYAPFLDNPSEVLAADAVNPDPQMADDEDLTDPSFGYLLDDALPDPSSGCIVGVIDDAIPFAHEQLRLAGGASRVAGIWVQDARSLHNGVGADLPSGLELRGIAISNWNAKAQAKQIPGEDAIYRLTGVLDMTRETTHSTAFATGHGAAVAMLAAGYPADDPQAQDHPVIAVNLPPRIIADSMGSLSPIAILQAFLFIISRARRLCRFIERRQGLLAGTVKLPLVINLSFGVTAGARDGCSLLELFMDAISGDVWPDLGPVRIVLPAGNHRLARLHAILSSGDDLGWRLPPDDRTVTPIEIWGPSRSSLVGQGMQVTLRPVGHPALTTAFTGPGQLTLLQDDRGRELARAYSQRRPMGSGKWRDGITVIIMPTCPERLGEPFAPPGEWRIGIAPGSVAGAYAVSVQRDEVIRGYPREARQSWLYDPCYQVYDPAGRIVETDVENLPASKVQRNGTINAYAGGRRTLTAGAIDQFRHRLMPYSSLSSTGQAGDRAVPVDRSRGEPGMIARGRGSGSFGLMSGTSMAAPQLTRWLSCPDMATAAGITGSFPKISRFPQF